MALFFQISHKKEKERNYNQIDKYTNFCFAYLVSSISCISCIKRGCFSLFKFIKSFRNVCKIKSCRRFLLIRSNLFLSNMNVVRF